ncbi:dye-decolorizing heme-containing peroxidase [Gnomoniopsis sp. IMI 355080]|nr:dye-decolorizing heme-containing peroxidase [Gnomoniopsis sp. IMI 355080]
MSSSAVDLKNVQGDILIGFPKKAERFFFFEIKHDVRAFRAGLHELVPLITTSEDVNSGREQIAKHRQHNPNWLPIAFTNIAFSAKGIEKLGLNASEAQDAGFTSGMLPDAQQLGDAGKLSSDGKFDPSWAPEFKQGNIDGVILVAGDSQNSVDKALTKALSVLRNTVSEVINIFGHSRPGKEDGHEHFGFEDGLSNPAVDGITKDLSTQGPVDQGVILIGRKGDSVTGRPSWALDGSFLAFRYLQQLVPEFNNFLKLNATRVNDPSINTAELLGARLTGRWKSGAPIQVTPLKDDPKLAADPNRNNVFTFDKNSQERCPFAAHVRKMNPRGDFDGVEGVPDPKAAISTHRVIRRGIQYGPETTDHENQQNKTEKDRGLLFVCYQSNLTNGFQFLQKSWANHADFPLQKQQLPGLDPLIGQVVDADNIGVRTMTGADPANTAATLDMGIQTWVVPKGGEYFFSPSIAVLKDTFAVKPQTGTSQEL